MSSIGYSFSCFLVLSLSSSVWLGLVLWIQTVLSWLSSSGFLKMLNVSFWVQFSLPLVLQTACAQKSITSEAKFSFLGSLIWNRQFRSFTRTLHIGPIHRIALDDQKWSAASMFSMLIPIALVSEATSSWNLHRLFNGCPRNSSSFHYSLDFDGFFIEFPKKGFPLHRLLTELLNFLQALWAFIGW